MKQRRMLRTHRPRRGSAIIVVVWAIAIAALIGSAVQLSAFRQATLGNDALHRIQARWAARAGVENTMAIMQLHTREPFPGDAFAMLRDLEQGSTYDLFDAGYEIGHYREGNFKPTAGPLDEHSRLNVNGDAQTALSALEDMTPDVGSAILDWQDADDDASLLGVERSYYEAQANPVKPRNGPLRSTTELELVAGIWPEIVRGEDWDRDNWLDPNENDADRSNPDDQPDGKLDGGWGQHLTVYSVEDGATESGLPRIHLRWAEPGEVAGRLGISDAQAEILIAFGRNQNNTLDQLYTTEITQIDASGNVSPEPSNLSVEPLDDDQLRAVFNELTMFPLHERRPGRLNLNTVSSVFLRDLMPVLGLEDILADELVYLRQSSPEGIASLLDLERIPGMTRDMIQQLAGTFTTTSNVFTITSRGRSAVSGTEVEIIAVVDRSTIPVTILEYREQ